MSEVSNFYLFPQSLRNKACPMYILHIYTCIQHQDFFQKQSLSYIHINTETLQIQTKHLTCLKERIWNICQKDTIHICHLTGQMSESLQPKGR